jgi:ribosomal protein S18 acetylase RimI-like enzyme
MPINTPRRIGANIGQSLHDRISAKLLHYVYWRSGADATERAHPDLIVERDGNVLSVDAVGGAKLIYGFDNQRAFVDLFPEMFEELLPRIRSVVGAETVRFRLTYNPARPVVEPVLKRLWFTPSRDWLGFSLDRKTKLPAAAVAGVKFRPATEDDLDAIVRVDRESFPNTPILLEDMRTRLRSDRSEIVVATAGKDVSGFYLIEHPEDGVGWISVIAAGEAYRGRGIGRALTVRAAKRLFALGAREAGLSTDEGNATAIRLYVSLGFRQDQAGRDYTRPTDPDRIQQIRAEGQGKLIRFGGWR